MDESVVRAWWAHRQGLDGSLAGATPAQVLERDGWQRALGGVGPYLSVFARTGQTRHALEAGVADGEPQELPSARGCDYVVPAVHYALALRLGQGHGDEAGHYNLIFGERGAQRMAGLTDLQSHAILDRGTLIGLWEYDAETRSIVWGTFEVPSPGLSEAVASTERFIHDDLADCRAYGMDRPESRQPRIAALRALAHV
jgi:hypothetical protein